MNASPSESKTAAPATRIALVNFYYERRFDHFDGLIQSWRTTANLAGALSRAGCRVAVFQRFDADESFERDGVAYAAVADGLPPSPRIWQRARRFCRRLLAWRPDAIHVHGMSFPTQIAHLRRTFQGPLVLQNHADQPLKRWRARLQARAFRGVDAFLFAARELAEPWLARRIIANASRVRQIMEDGSRFQPGDRQAARARTGLTGSPIFLWVGHLNDNKDPFTALAGFERLLAVSPGARLYMIFRDAPLAARVRARISASQDLRDATTLIGAATHDDMEAYFQAADFFLLGSHREGSGYALMEALACGLTPVVTDIPTFRAMTDGGRLGFLFKPGDADSLARQLTAAVQLGPDRRSGEIRGFYERELGLEAIARKMTALYDELLGSPRS